MKVLHFITTMSSGGAERMLSKLASSDNVNEHVIVTLFSNDLHYDIKNIRLINLNFNNNYLSRLISVLSMKKIISEEKPDIIQTWLKLNYYGPLLKIFRNVKLVSNFRNGYTDRFNKSFVKFLNYWYKSFDAHIFVSKSSLIERERNGFKFNNKTIINNGFVVQDYSPSFNKKQLVVGHIGRYHPIKNQQLIVNSFNKFSSNRNVKLIMAGRDLEKNLLHTDNHKIEFLGNVKETERFYKSIDVLILTSFSEGFPNVIGEAMSYGIPVIASNAGESHEIIGSSGYKIYKNEEKEIVSILNEIYKNKSQLKYKSTLAKCYISQNYDFNLVLESYKNLYSNL